MYTILVLFSASIWISTFHNKIFSKVVQVTQKCVLYKEDFEALQAEPEEGQPSLRPTGVQAFEEKEGPLCFRAHSVTSDRNDRVGGQRNYQQDRLPKVGVAIV